MTDQVSLESFCEAHGLRPSPGADARVSHVYSHFKVAFFVYTATLEKEWSSEFWVSHRWVSASDLKDMGKAGVHIKALAKLGF